jgi:predicted histidine transporter YuiF (NhaC family)
MPLNEHEQRILEEIERQFYEEDPKLAETVAKTTLESMARRWQRLAIAGFVVGLVVMLVFFTSSTLLAIAGFLVMLVSAGWITTNLRHRQGGEGSSTLVESWAERLRQRWRRDG